MCSAIVEGQIVQLQQIVHGPAVLLLLGRQRRLRCRWVGGGVAVVAAAVVCKRAAAAGVLMVVVLIGMVYRCVRGFKIEVLMIYADNAERLSGTRVRRNVECWAGVQSK